MSQCTLVYPNPSSCTIASWRNGFWKDHRIRAQDFQSHPTIVRPPHHCSLKSHKRVNVMQIRSNRLQNTHSTRRLAFMLHQPQHYPTKIHLNDIPRWSTCHRQTPQATCSSELHTYYKNAWCQDHTTFLAWLNESLFDTISLHEIC